VDSLSSTDIILFEGFRLDRRRGALFRRDECGVFAPIAMGSRALEILGVLVERPGDLVSRAEIMAAVWPETAVEDSNLNVQIAALRRVLDQGRTDGSCIQTVPGRGYRFTSALTRVGSEAWSNAATVSPSVAEPLPDEPSLAMMPFQDKSGDPEQEYLADGKAPRRLRSASAKITAAASAVLIIALIAWWVWPATRSPTPAAIGTAAMSISQAAVAPRLSIVVLPFANLSDDPAQQYFVDGVTEDLTTDLSRIANSFVISGNTAFTYKDKPVNAKQIGRELGVRYVLEGSVQRLGNHVRVNAQLIDPETDTHLWTERFDRDIGDLFAVQNEITSRIAAALSLELVSAEATRPTDHPEVLDYIFRARAAFLKGPGRDSFAEGLSLYDHALALDPQSVEALTGVASTLASRVMNGLADSSAADLERAKGMIEQASAISPRSPLTLTARAHWLKAQGRCEEAIPEYEALIALNRNSVTGLANLGQCKIATGSLDDGIALEEQVLRLSPRDPFNGNRYSAIGQVYLLQSRADAILWLEKGRNLSPRNPLVHAWLAAAYGLKGETERAAAELAEARRLVGDDRYASIARVRAFGAKFWSSTILPLYETTYLAGLRKAGVPEE
jgi:adenylate cyclase